MDDETSHLDTQGQPVEVLAVGNAPVALRRSLFQEKAFIDEWGETVAELMSDSAKLKLNIMWDTYAGCTGWNVEAANYLVALDKVVFGLQEDSNAMSAVHAVAGQGFWCTGWPSVVSDTLTRIGNTKKLGAIDVWIAHKPPPSYPRFPYAGNIKYNERPKYVIGRSMSESTKVPREWLQYADRVDEIWVPSAFSKAAFVSSGFDAKRIAIVPEGIDTNLFNPDAITPPPARFAKLLERSNGLAVRRFLAVGKWEPRKGIELLLSAYFSAFDASQNVELLLHTYDYKAIDPFDIEVLQRRVRDAATEFDGALASVASQHGVDILTLVPKVTLLVGEIDMRDMPALYAAADIYVSASLGEGWGAPLMEAMAMGLPCITAAHSGALALAGVDGVDSDADASRFASSAAVKLVQCTATRALDGSSGDWCTPVQSELVAAMQAAVARPADIRAMGERARRRVKTHFSSTAVRDIVVQRLAALTSDSEKSKKKSGFIKRLFGIGNDKKRDQL